MSFGLPLLMIVIVAALIGVVALLFARSPHADANRREELNARRKYQQPWDAESSHRSSNR